VLDIEGAWELAHEDIAALGPASVIGVLPSQLYIDHGTAVAGIIAADADAHGIMGFSPDVEFLVSSVYNAPSGFSGAQAIANGLPSLSPGDVLVIELHTPNLLGYGPTEWIQADFDAILVATNLGVVTVEAAGNGGVDLDSPVLGGLFDINVRDSGAIIVGATGAGTFTRAGFSSYGSRVDVNGWGRQVHTTGYGDLFNASGLGSSGDPRQFYTRNFSGTSSATAIVSGVVASLRGAAIAQLSPNDAAALDGFAIRNLLRTTGTPIPTISNRPDCSALFVAAGITSGLSVRSEPQIGQVCHFDLDPAFASSSSDLWAFVGSFAKDNQPMTPPFGGRILLAAPLSPFGFGSFTTTQVTLSWAIPNAMALRGLRYYLQGITYENATGMLATTNSVQCFVRR